MATTRKRRTAAERDAWNAGFAIACIELATTHMQDDLAAMLLKSSGLNLKICKRAGLDEEDLKVIKKMLD